MYWNFEKPYKCYFVTCCCWRTSLQAWILVLLAFNFIGMFDFYRELLHVSYAQMQAFWLILYSLKWQCTVIFRMMTHLLLGMNNSLQWRERPLTTHDVSSVLIVSQKMLDVSQSIVPDHDTLSHMTGGFNPFWECWTVTIWHHKVWIVVQSILYYGWLVIRLGWLKHCTHGK